MYEIGRVYIWQNCRVHKYLEGTETTVTGPVRRYWDGMKYSDSQETSTPSASNACGYWVAAKGQLRPKNPPTGEQKIRSMFEPKPVMEVA